MNMNKARDIVLKPIVTEKTTILRESENKYVFRVLIEANKIEIKKAIEKLFTVKVKNVTVMRRRGKIKRLGRFSGRKPSFKRAICTLDEGDKIEIFEGA